MPYVWIMPPELQLHGGSAIITRTVRRIPPAAIDPTIKNLQWGDFVRGIQEAQDRDAFYPLLTDGGGNLTEGCGFNVFLVKDSILYTPSRGVLEGVTRKTVLEIAKKRDIQARVEHVPIQLAYEAGEIFLSTTAGGVLSIVELDGKPVGKGERGPVISTIWDDYWDYWALHYDPGLSQAIDYHSF